MEEQNNQNSETPKGVGVENRVMPKIAEEIIGIVYAVEEAMYDYGDIQDGNGNSLLVIPLLKYEGQKIKITIKKL